MAESEQRQKVLVLGAGGKVGQLLARVWRETPPEHWAPVYQTSSTSLNDAIRWCPGEPVENLPRVAAILALWGVTGGHASNLDDNSGLAITALEMAAQLGAGRVLLCSSAAVYPGSTQKHAESDSDLQPPGAYGRAKLRMEQAAAAWCAAAQNGPQTCILRLANVVGADSLFAALDRPAPVMLDRFPDGKGPLRSYITAGDLARIVVSVLDCPAPDLPGVLNVAGKDVIAMADLADAAGAGITWQKAPAGAIQKVELDTERLEKLAGPSQSSHDAGLAIADWRRWSEPV